MIFQFGEKNNMRIGRNILELANSADYAVISRKDKLFEVNRVLRNTYFLLSLTMLWSAVIAYFAMRANVAPPSIIILIIGMFGLSFLTQALQNSKWGLVAVFAFTGFMGYTIAPLLNFYISAYSNGAALVVTALGGTATIFLALSLYVLITRKNFNFLGGVLFAGILVAFIASICSIFFHLSILSVLVSALFILISSGLILFYTSLIVNRGINNYILATISIYVAIFNLFVSLLNILGFFAGNRR